MTICPKCNKQLEEGAKYCDYCGTQASQIIFCHNCGGQMSAQAAFCPGCGAAVSEGAEIFAQAVKAPKEKKNPLQRIPKKAIMFGGIGVIALVVIILAASMLLGGGRIDGYGLYLKDGEIVYTDYSGEGTFEITSRLVSGEDVSDSEMISAAYAAGSCISFSDDGNRIFFPDRMEPDGEMSGITLYYRDVNKPDGEAEKIDSDVLMYTINGNGTKVLYVKGVDRALYLHDLTAKEKIASGVLFFDVSDDFKKIGYGTDEGDYYLWHAGGDVVKMVGGVTSVEYVSPDLSTIYYIKDGSLYKQVEGTEDRVKISTDVSRVISVYDSGEVYYTKAESTVKTAFDFLNDDMAASDAMITEPEYPDYPDSPDYPSWWDYDTDEEYEAAKAQYEADYQAYEATCDQLRAEYNAAYEAYSDKLDRDAMREDLRNMTIDTTEYTLCYFDGTEETVITNNLAEEWVQYADDKPVMVLEICDQDDVEKIKLSDAVSSYDDVNDIMSQVSAALYNASETYVAVGASLSLVEENNAVYFIPSDGSAVYFLDDISDDAEGELYKIAIADGQAGNPELYDSDVSIRDISFTEDNKPIYFKDVNFEDMEGDFYIAGEEIDYDVYLGQIHYMGNVITYFTDWDSESGYGTLKRFRDGTKTKIKDDVHAFNITVDGDILYLYDYSTNYHTGTLYLYNDGEPQKIDDDVAAIVRVSNQAIKVADYYGW